MTNDTSSIYVVIVFPTEITAGFVTIIQYDPPTLEARKFLEAPWQPISEGKAKRFGAYYVQSRPWDPMQDLRKYFFRALVFYNAASAGWLYADNFTLIEAGPEPGAAGVFYYIMMGALRELWEQWAPFVAVLVLVMLLVAGLYVSEFVSKKTRRAR